MGFMLFQILVPGHTPSLSLFDLLMGPALAEGAKRASLAHVIVIHLIILVHHNASWHCPTQGSKNNFHHGGQVVTSHPG